MSDTGTEGREDLRPDNSLREHIQSAIAHHRPAGPDTDLVVQNAKEASEAVRRARSDGKEPREFSDLRPADRTRLQIRSAVTEVKAKATNAATKPAEVDQEHQQLMHKGAPHTWSAEAKALFDGLPEPVKLAAIRDANFTYNVHGRLAREYGALKEVLEPHRQTYAAHGLSDAQAIKRLFEWEGYIRTNPQQALYQIASELGLLPQQQPQQYEQQQYQQQSVDPYAIQQTLERFAKDKPYFEAVRVQMGMLMQEHPENYGGDENAALERAYRDACKLAGYAEKTSNSKQAAAVSPSTRSPSAAPTSSKRGTGVRASIRAAIQEARGNL
jgi:hypothetical protein